MQIKRAIREKVWLKIAVTGATGSGKTYGAIGIAKGLSEDGRVLVIDTENNSASYYAGDADVPGQWIFDTIAITAPFTPEKYLQALQAGIDAGYKTIVIDSLTHEWDASGGLLDKKAQKDKQPHGNSYTNWNGIKQEQNRFVETILQSKCNIIATMRSKMEYVQEYCEKQKKNIVRKIGLAPISSSGMEYEYGCVFDVDQESHFASVTKDRTGLFDGRSFKLDSVIGKELKAWRDGGAELTPVATQTPEASKSAAPPPPAIQTPINPKTEISQEAANFVDGVTGETDMEAKWRAENKKDEFVENVTFISDSQKNELEDLIIEQKVPLDAFLAFQLSKKRLLSASDGMLRIDRILVSAYPEIHAVLTTPQRCFDFIKHLSTIQKSA